MEVKQQTTAEKFFLAAQDLMVYLAGRWLDEHEYEKIEDYQIPIEKVAQPLNVQIVKMTKRPFGCHFACDGKTYALKVKTTSYEYWRIDNV